jgi:hypothetical protein
MSIIVAVFCTKRRVAEKQKKKQESFYGSPVNYIMCDQASPDMLQHSNDSCAAPSETPHRQISHRHHNILQLPMPS